MTAKAWGGKMTVPVENKRDKNKILKNKERKRGERNKI